MIDLVKALKACQTVRKHNRFWFKMFLRPSQHFCRIQTGNTTETYEHGMSFFTPFQGGDKWCLSFSSAATLATRAFAALVDVIDLNESLKRSVIIGFFDDHLQLILDPGSSWLRDSKEPS
jgi:hypothetical protein